MVTRPFASKQFVDLKDDQCFIADSTHLLPIFIEWNARCFTEEEKIFYDY